MQQDLLDFLQLSGIGQQSDIELDVGTQPIYLLDGRWGEAVMLGLLAMQAGLG